MNDKPLPFDQRTVTTQDEDGRKLVEAFPGQGVCDFCLSTAVAYEHDAGPTSVTVGAQTHVGDDPWNACPQCHAMIEADDRRALMQRAITGLRKRQDESGAVDLDALASLIAQFMDTRGESRPV